MTQAPRILSYKASRIESCLGLQVLDVNGISDERQVQRQFRKLAKQVHPDKCNVEGAEAAFKAICLAAAELSSAIKGMSCFVLSPGHISDHSARSLTEHGCGKHDLFHCRCYCGRGRGRILVGGLGG